jgi:tRNA U55 pseudouridine synthase TruB
LRRHSIGSFNIENAVAFDEARDLIKTGKLDEKLINPASAINFPKMEISKNEALKIASGRTIEIPDGKFEDLFSLVYNGRLIAVCRILNGSEKKYRYECVLEGPEEIENGIS